MALWILISSLLLSIQMISSAPPLDTMNSSPDLTIQPQRYNIETAGPSSTASSRKGSRYVDEDSKNEDKFSNLVFVPANSISADSIRIPFNAVYDGHGGDQVSTFLAEKFPSTLASHLPSIDPSSPRLSPEEALLIERAIEAAVLETDADICSTQTLVSSDAGSTMAMVLQVKDIIFMANLGDSRAMVDASGTIHVTKDHLAADPAEQSRVKEAGGFVTAFDIPRVMGALAPSRAFGDCSLKKRQSDDINYSPDGWVSSKPSIQQVQMADGVKHQITVATDGMWDVLTPVFVERIWNRVLLKNENRPDAVSRVLVDFAFTKGSKDDITAVTNLLSFQ